MVNVDTLIAFVGATAALAISPGPDNIYVLTQSLTNGKRFGMATVCGLITGCLVHTTLLAFGVSAVIAANPKLFFTIKIFGAIYLLYLAYKVYKTPVSFQLDNQAVPKKSLQALFVQGFFMNVLNPKVSLFFLSFFPAFLFSNTLSHVTQFYVLGALFMLTSFIIFSAIALLSGQVKQYITTHKNAGLVLKWLQIVVFFGITVFILL